MNFKKALHIFTLTALVALGGVSLFARKTAIEKQDLETKEAYNDVKRDLEHFLKEQKNVTGQAAESLHESGTRLLKNLKEGNTERTKELKESLEDFLERQKSFLGSAAEKVRKSSSKALKSIKETTAKGIDVAYNAVSNSAHAVRDKVQSAGAAMTDSLHAISESSFVARTTNSTTERAGLTNTNPQRYRIEIAVPGFSSSELTINPHLTDTHSKPWIEIVAERTMRNARRAHGLDSSFFNVQKYVVQRTLPYFVDTTKGKYTKYIENGVVIFEFNINEKDRSNTNLLALDTERITIS